MPDIPIDTVPAGAILTRAIYGADGVLIAAAGTRLTPNLLALLRDRGQRRLAVVTSERAAAQQRRPAPPIDKDAIRAEVERRFTSAQPLSAFMNAVQEATTTLLVARAIQIQEEEGFIPQEGRT